MPRIAVGGSSRTSLRIRAKEKALLMSAAALSHTNLTDFGLHHSLRAAKAVIEHADHVQLSESWRVLDLVENPPAPTAKLTAAARAIAHAVINRMVQKADQEEARVHASSCTLLAVQIICEATFSTRRTQ